MDIGFVASGNVGEALRRAARLGFAGIELNFIWGQQSDLETWTDDDTKRALEVMAETGTRILAVSTGWANHLAPDRAARERAMANMRRAIALAPQLGTSIVTCNAFGDLETPPGGQVQAFAQVFGEYARWCEDVGVRIGIENCPHVHTAHGIQIGNIAYSPDLFAQLFAAVPSLAIGMEYDPSHYYWLGVDYVGVIRQFADRMVFAHAKDTEILSDRLALVGIYGDGWWRYRVPGMGQVDWEGITRALAEIGYHSGMAIEHEDPVFEGQRFDEGLSLGLRFLRQALRQ
jgi:sugar phosphate isomerase/epimerase